MTSKLFSVENDGWEEDDWNDWSENTNNSNNNNKNNPTQQQQQQQTQVSIIIVVLCKLLLNSIIFSANRSTFATRSISLFQY